MWVRRSLVPSGALGGCTHVHAGQVLEGPPSFFFLVSLVLGSLSRGHFQKFFSGQRTEDTPSPLSLRIPNAISLWGTWVGPDNSLGKWS